MNSWHHATHVVFTQLVPFMATLVLLSYLGRAIVQRQFSLRSLLVAVTAVCIIAAIWGAAQ